MTCFMFFILVKFHYTVMDTFTTMILHLKIIMGTNQRKPAEDSSVIWELNFWFCPHPTSGHCYRLLYCCTIICGWVYNLPFAVLLLILIWFSPTQPTSCQWDIIYLCKWDANKAKFGYLVCCILSLAMY